MFSKHLIVMRSEEHNNCNTSRSWHGYITQYLGSPIVWKSPLQTKIALSSTESEYTGLSYAWRGAIPIMQLMEEMKAPGLPVTKHNAQVHCHVFEDISSTLEMAKLYKFQPRTKHMNNHLHHFHSYVENGTISIHAIPSEDQLSDSLTKPSTAD